jgi:hypothetical protein
LPNSPLPLLGYEHPIPYMVPPPRQQVGERRGAIAGSMKRSHRRSSADPQIDTTLPDSSSSPSPSSQDPAVIEERSWGVCRRRRRRSRGAAATGCSSSPTPGLPPLRYPLVHSIHFDQDGEEPPRAWISTGPLVTTREQGKEREGRSGARPT